MNLKETKSFKESSLQKKLKSNQGVTYWKSAFQKSQEQNQVLLQQLLEAEEQIQELKNSLAESKKKMRELITSATEAVDSAEGLENFLANLGLHLPENL